MVLGQKKLYKSVHPFWRCILSFLLEKENFSKRENKLLLQNGWTDLANFFWTNSSRDQDGANEKRINQIGPAVLEEKGRKQA